MKIFGINLHFYSLCLAVFVLAACTTAPVDLSEVHLEETSATNNTPSDHLATQVPSALDEATPSSSSEYPPDTRTGNPEIDAVIAAIMASDVDTRVALVRYTESACTLADGLGGPPKCQEGESEGTLVTAFPVLSSEGTQIRPENIHTVFDFSVRGLLAVYRVSDSAIKEDGWPAGEYGVVFTSEDGNFLHTVTVLMEDGRIVRLDFGMVWPPFESIENRAGEFILPPFNQ